MVKILKDHFADQIIFWEYRIEKSEENHLFVVGGDICWIRWSVFVAFFYQRTSMDELVVVGMRYHSLPSSAGREGQ